MGSHSQSLEDWIFKSMGGLAIFICMLSSIPQVFKMIKTKQTNDLSLTSILLLFTGTAMLEVYAFYFNLWEMFFPNIFTILSILIQIILKKCYDKQEDVPGLLDKFIDNDIEDKYDDNKIYKPPSSDMDLDEDLLSR